MATKIGFTNLLERMVVEESLSVSAARAQSSRRYNIFLQLSNHWRMDFTAGKSARDNDSDLPVGADRLRELERNAGGSGLENERLKRERRSWMPPPAGLPTGS